VNTQLDSILYVVTQSVRVSDSIGYISQLILIRKLESTLQVATSNDTET